MQRRLHYVPLADEVRDCGEAGWVLIPAGIRYLLIFSAVKFEDWERDTARWAGDGDRLTFFSRVADWLFNSNIVRSGLLCVSYLFLMLAKRQVSFCPMAFGSPVFPPQILCQLLGSTYNGSKSSKRVRYYRIACKNRCEASSVWFTGSIDSFIVDAEVFVEVSKHIHGKSYIIQHHFLR